MIKLGGVSIAVLFLGGCMSLAPSYQQPASPVPVDFSLDKKPVANMEVLNIELIGWRTFFVDQQLQKYIETALQNNRDLKLAVLNTEEARQRFRSTQADRYPRVDASTEAMYSGGIKRNTKAQNNYDLGLMAAFEVDFFGRLKNMSVADQERYFATEQAQRSAQILLVSNVAQAYLDEQLATEQLALAKKTLSNTQRSLRLMEQQLMSGKSNILALAQARGMIETAKIVIAQRANEQAQAQHVLRYLTGQYDLNFVSASTKLKKSFFNVTVPSNLPSSVLLRRPDILGAEHTLIAANADIGVARAAFFPNVSLTGGLGNSSTDLGSLFDLSTGIWKFVPKIELPVFNVGKNKANLSIAQIKQQRAVIEYEQKIQLAFKEVSGALSIRQNNQQQMKAQQRYLSTQHVVLQRTSGLYASGAPILYLEVLDAQRNVFAAQQMLFDLNYAQKANEINLFIALGGGWAE